MKPLIWIESVIEKFSHSRVEIKVKVLNTHTHTLYLFHPSLRTVTVPFRTQMLVSKVEPSRVLLSFGPLLYLGKYVYCQDCYNFVFFSSTLRRQSYNNTRIHMKITLCMNMNSYYTHYGTSFMFSCSKVLDFTMYCASYISFKMTVKTLRLLLVHSSDNIMSL